LENGYSISAVCYSRSGNTGRWFITHQTLRAALNSFVLGAI